jgi:hypothetical protein
VLEPLAAQPVFDLRAGRQEAALELEQGASEGGGEVWNHVLSLNPGFLFLAANLTPQCSKMAGLLRSTP